MAWLTFFPGQHLARRLQRDDLLSGLVGTGVFLLIGGALWLDTELLWSLREQEHAPPAPPSALPREIADTLAQRHLFGLPSATPERQEGKVEFSLLGILADRRSTSGAAILLAQGEKHPMIAHLGETIAPGIRLSALAPRQATLTRNGTLVILDLQGSAMTANASAPSTPHKPVFD